jgi:branched-chain amino acid transport system permease protein
VDFFLQNFINALQWGSFYALIALGYTLVYGVIHLINFAHGDVFMAGAYFGFFAASLFLGAYSSGFALPLPGWAILILAILASMVLTAALGVTLERAAYRPLRKAGAGRLPVVITALMAGLLLENGNLALLGASRRNFPELIEKTTYNIAGLNVTNVKIMVVVVTLLAWLLLEFIVRRTKLGMAMRAASYDQLAVPLMGIPIDRVVVFTFVLGSIGAALAGVLFAVAYPVLEPYMGLLIGWKAFIAAVVGGIGSIRGAMLGGYILGFAEIFVAAYFRSSLRDLIAFALLLVILVIRPTGLFGGTGKRGEW